MYTHDLPRSGVSRLTPSDVRHQMYANGWPTLPIASHDDERDGRGKRPVMLKWARLAAFEAFRLPRRSIESWARQFPHAPGTGIPCGNLVGIDIDVTDPVLADRIEAIAREVFGRTPFAREGRAPKRLLVYRAGEAIKTDRRKALDGSNDGIDVLADGAQFVAYGIHPGTGRPYRWNGVESPLTASPDEAAEITGEKVASFLNAVNGVLPLSVSGGTGGRKGGGPSAEIVRDTDGFVIDGREAYLMRCVWQAACRLSEAGEALTIEAVAVLAWDAFATSARLDVGGRVWTIRSAEQKARSLLDRVKRGLAILPSKREAADPSYPEDGRPLTEAEAAARRGIEEFFTRYAFEHRNALLTFKAGGMLLAPAPRGRLIRIEAGIGKTEAAIEAGANAVRAGLNIMFAVSTLR